MVRHTKAYIALIFVCIVWGTTYLALRVGVRHYPPFLFAGIRQSVAGVLLMALALAIVKKKDLSKKNILLQMLVGFLMITLGNGLVTWGEQYVASGIAALLCALVPLFAVIFGMASPGKAAINGYIAVGMLLGICGVGLIFKDNLGDFANPAYLTGIIVIIVATASWALGSLTNKRNTKPVNPVFNSGMQLFFGGLFLLIGSPFVDNYHGFTLWHQDSFAALIYLILFGSLLAYAAYMYALSALPVGIATLYAYVNPLVAVVLGYLLLREPLSLYTGLAFITIMAGVYLVNKGYKKQDITLKKEQLQQAMSVADPN